MTTQRKNQHFWTSQPELEPYGYAYCDLCKRVKAPDGRIITYKQAIKEINERYKESK